MKLFDPQNDQSLPEKKSKIIYLDSQGDVLIDSAYECVAIIKDEQLRREKEAFKKKTRIVKPVDFTPEYWKKWKLDNKKASANQIKAREKRHYVAHHGRVAKLQDLGPSLAGCSAYKRIKGSLPFSKQSNASQDLGDKLDENAESNLFDQLKIESSFLQQFDALGLLKDRGEQIIKCKAQARAVSFSPIASSTRKKTKQQQQQRPYSDKGTSFGLSTRDDWNKILAPQGLDSMTVSPAAYDVASGLKATLPNHGTFVFTGRKNAGLTKMMGSSSSTPAPGSYDTTAHRTRPLHPITFVKGPREDKTSQHKEKGNGPQDYCVEIPLPHVPAPAFNGLLPYQPQSESSINTKDVEAMEGFGHQCDFAQHVQYGKCLNEGCSGRGLWEKRNAWLLKQRQKKKDKDEKKRMIKRMQLEEKGEAREGEGGSDEGGLKSVFIKTEGDSNKATSSPQQQQQRRNKLRSPSTTLHYAVRRGELQVVDRLLKEETCDINCRDREKMTPLHWAAKLGHFRIAKRLVENDRHPFVTPKGFVHPRRRPDLNLVDLRGDSIMHLATRGGYWYIVELFYKAGSRLDIKNEKGATPIDDAKTNALCSKLLSMMEVDKAREEVRLAQWQLLQAKQQQQHQVKIQR